MLEFNLLQILCPNYIVGPEHFADYCTLSLFRTTEAILWKPYGRPGRPSHLNSFWNDWDNQDDRLIMWKPGLHIYNMYLYQADIKIMDFKL